jgi:hypothetical protein
VQNRFETGHNTDFNHTSILDKATEYMDHMIKKAIEIRLHPNNFNRGIAFTLSQSWQLVTKKYTQAPIQRRARAKQALESAH